MTLVRILLTRQKCIQNFGDINNFVRGYSCKNSAIKGYTANMDYQPVADFYTGKSVFITGSTGFIGKVIVEKLLYATKLDKIYVLIRNKKNIDVNTRLQHMIASPLFSRVKVSNPHYFAKLVPIQGDIGLPSLGINQEDEKTLIDNVSVVFHSAATVMFNEPLSVVMNINFKGTQQLLDLSKRMKKMEAFVHISTAYTHPHRSVTVETIYDAPAEVNEVYQFLKKYGDNKKYTKEFLKGYPSTYNFSKAITESYIANNHENVPTAIVKPSVGSINNEGTKLKIVEAVKKLKTLEKNEMATSETHYLEKISSMTVSPAIAEPVKGWTDSWLGATSLLYSVGKGWNVITYGNKDCKPDFMPVDYVANLIIVSAAKLQGAKKVQVYNCTSGEENPVTLAECIKYFTAECIKQGYNETPYLIHMFTKSRKVVYLVSIILQKIPAHVADFCLKIRGIAPRYVKIISHVESIRNELAYYASNSWVFRADRARRLYSKLSPEDQKQFPCNPANIVWSEYIKDYCNGVFKYLNPRL